MILVIPLRIARCETPYSTVEFDVVAKIVRYGHRISRSTVTVSEDSTARPPVDLESLWVQTLHDDGALCVPKLPEVQITLNTIRSPTA